MGNQQSPASDAENYLRGYPSDLVDDEKADLNYRFYTNQIPSKPDGDLIDNIHKEWFGNHQLLEQHHGYIQWLFPIREDSPFNSRAQRLMRHEIKKMSKDEIVRKRLILSYRLMLDFYGMELQDETTGAIGRAPNWQVRYEFLNHSTHNFLRITRILKCLGELGLDHYQAPFVENIFTEIGHGNLKGLFKSARDYFAAVVRDDKARARLLAMAEACSNPAKIVPVGGFLRPDDEKQSSGAVPAVLEVAPDAIEAPSSSISGGSTHQATGVKPGPYYDLQEGRKEDDQEI